MNELSPLAPADDDNSAGVNGDARGGVIVVAEAGGLRVLRGAHQLVRAVLFAR